MLRRRGRFIRRSGKRSRSSFRRNVRRIAKRTVLNTVEKKYKSTDVYMINGNAYSGPNGGWPLYHNGCMTFDIVNNTSGGTNVFPLNGTGETVRSGAEIHSKGFMIRGSINVPSDRKNTSFYMYVLEYNSVQGSPTIYTDFFKNITGSARLDPMNKDRFKAKKIGAYRLYAADLATTQNGCINFKKWLPFKRKLTFKDDTSAQVVRGMKEYLSIVIIPYDTTASLTSDILGYARINATLYYADP
jgi:hypothetical protein